MECEVKEVNGLIRSGKNDLEHKLRIDIDKKAYRFFASLPTYVANVISRHRIGPDGRTAETRRTGESWMRPAFRDLRTRDDAERTAASTWFLRTSTDGRALYGSSRSHRSSVGHDGGRHFERQWCKKNARHLAMVHGRLG